MMLPETFIDWWFNPWAISADVTQAPGSNDLVARRDGYRAWCASAMIPGDLPLHFDPVWSSVAMMEGATMQRAAGLFMGLIAARQPDQEVLRALPLSDQKWCRSIAATQPLQAYALAHPESTDTLDICGLAELAIRLELGFPGLWPRLQLHLPANSQASIALRRQNNWAGTEDILRSTTRSQRCWRLCQQRSEETS
ncbi:MAG: hypothetical protein GZ090_06945 [Oxalobacteraceae bacterium]|nr:hypothetical protein [Oxalobacteraceae bacterium]